MRRYSIIHPLWMSFYSGDLYEDVGRNWHASAILYLLLLLAITWIPGVMKLDEEISHWIDASAADMVEQVPEMNIQGGKVSVAASGPVLIRDPETNTVFMIIDVTGQYTSLNGTDASVLIKETEIMVRNNSSEIQTYTIPPDEEPITITRETLYEWLEIIRGGLSIVLYPILVLATYVYRLIQALVYASIGRLFLQQLNASMEYMTLVRLAAVAVTPAIILDTIHGMMEVAMPFWWAICFLLAMGYLYFAIKTNVTPPEAYQTETV